LYSWIKKELAAQTVVGGLQRSLRERKEGKMYGKK
jgi:hypothetical protein